jgi:hypothetical protein
MPRTPPAVNPLGQTIQSVQIVNIPRAAAHGGRGYAASVTSGPSAHTGASTIDLTRLTLLAQNVVQTLRLFLASQPVQTVRGLSVELGVDVNMVQRTLAAVDPAGADDVLMALHKLPPVESLRRVLKAPGKQARPDLREAHAGACASLRALEGVIDELGGPRRFKLKVGQALERRATGVPMLPEQALDAPARMREAGAQIAGSCSRAKVRVNIVWERPDEPGTYINALAGGAVGTRLQPGGMPMYGMTDIGGVAAEGEGGLSETLSLLKEWTTPNLATSTRQTPDGGSVVVVDDHRTEEPGGVNLFLANRTQFKAEGERLPGRVFLSLLNPVLTPADRMVADVYFARALASRLVPHAGVYLPSPALSIDPATAWRTRVPLYVPVEALGAGLHRASSDAWEGQSGLTRDLARRAGADVTNLVGFRIDVKNPLWGMIYCLWFTYAEG